MAAKNPCNAHPSPASFTFSTALEDRKPRRWQKGVLLGSGAFGQVYIVHNVDTGEEMAMKQVALHPEGGGDNTKVGVGGWWRHYAIVRHGCCFQRIPGSTSGLYHRAFFT